MNGRLRLLLALLLTALAVPTAHADDPPAPNRGGKISWKKTVVDRTFRSEGVAVVDVNRDGRADIIIGDCWYEAPKNKGGAWTRHILRADRKFDPRGYSEAFCCFTDDFTGDGYPDVIVIPFPGNPCYWYENPGSKGGLWKAHFLTNSACNETPIYVDLFKNGKRVLVMGWQPERMDAKGKKQGNYDDRGEMCYFLPGKDPTQPWQRHSISGPSVPGKFEVPGTRRFSHGLGHGDVNGDGRADIICTGGWWEQPASEAGKPWTFHRASLSNGCADMYTYDVDGDGQADIICSAPHWYGFWWFQGKKKGNQLTFVQREIVPLPATLAAEAGKRNFLGKEERQLYDAINRLRDGHYRKAALAAHPELSRMARDHAERSLKAKAGHDVNIAGKYTGKIVNVISVSEQGQKADALARVLLDKAELGILRPGFEIGIGYADGEGKTRRYTIVIGERGLFSVPAGTHALHCVDLNGDGLKDLVTGRRYWAHAPNPKGGGGDAGVNDPPVLCWFRASKDKSGMTTFLPEVIDDDSGVGTQFAIADINGDGLLDIVIANKRGVFIFEQMRGAAADAAPPRRQE